MSKSARVPNFAIRRVRELERQETRAEFAEAIAQKAAELGESVSPSERYVARLEDGDIKCPHPAYRRVLTELCGRTMAELGFASPNSIRETGGENFFGAHIEVTPETIYPFTLPASGLREIEALRRSIDERIGGAVVASTGIDDWELTAIQHGRATRYAEPGLLLADVTADLAELNHALARSRSAAAVRRLTRVTAQLAGIVCLILVKLDERAEFRKWARTARIAAEEAGDPLTVSWVRAQECYGYYYSGDLHEAISIARHAQELAGDTPCVGAVLAAALEARALARLSPEAAPEAADALRRAEMILSRLEDSDVIPSAFGYSEAQLRFHEGSTHTHLRNTATAWQAQQQALELIPADDFTDRTLTHLDRAICLAHDGDSKAAVSHAASALAGLSGQQRRGIITARARETMLAIPASHRALPAVREFTGLLGSLSEGNN